MKYVCPKHANIVLFEERLDRIEMFVPDKVSYCPLCKINYYKKDCVMKI